MKVFWLSFLLLFAGGGVIHSAINILVIYTVLLLGRGTTFSVILAFLINMVSTILSSDRGPLLPCSNLCELAGNKWVAFFGPQSVWSHVNAVRTQICLLRTEKTSCPYQCELLGSDFLCVVLRWGVAEGGQSCLYPWYWCYFKRPAQNCVEHQFWGGDFSW